MQKIPTLFIRDSKTHLVIDQVTPGCEWVLAGEGTATRKYDGTCVMLDENGKWWSRREVKPGKETPDNFVQVDQDEITGIKVGWVPIAEGGHHAAFSSIPAGMRPAKPGTYELCGVKVNKNPEKISNPTGHMLYSHDEADEIVFEEPLLPDYEDIKQICFAMRTMIGMEGIVWHHPDGRMAKIKALDFSKNPPDIKAKETYSLEETTMR